MKNDKPKAILKQNRTSQISIRMTPMERMLIESRAKSSGYSMSQFMVESSLGKELKLLSEEEKLAYKNLATYHTNFNRISTLIRHNQDIRRELNEVIQEIKKQLEVIQ
uniref:plasmid mobilization protein n=1 Tax=Elizabethkingia anophelis TaxID=1117645 RepID=UPI000465B1F5